MELTDKTSYTRRDYAALPEGAPYQLIEGKLVMSPAPTVFHQLIIGNLHGPMRSFVTRHRLGMVILSPVDVYLNDTNAFQPDLVFVSNERMPIVGDRIEGAPDLIVEILSPSTAKYDLHAKKDTYARANVREYWVVNPLQKTVAVFVLEAGSFRLQRQFAEQESATSVVLEGFTIPLDELFATQHR